MANVLCHPDDIRSFPKSSGWYNVSWALCHPDEIAPGRISSGWPMQDIIRMTYDVALYHPGEITKIWFQSHPDDLAVPSISFGWLMVGALCHPNDLPGVGISSGWVTANSLCHPNNILFHIMSSGWLNWGWYLMRMIYGNVIMSPGWDTLSFLSHPDEIADFDFPQHTVALQRFRSIRPEEDTRNRAHKLPDILYIRLYIITFYVVCFVLFGHIAVHNLFTLNYLWTLFYISKCSLFP